MNNNSRRNIRIEMENGKMEREAQGARRMERARLTWRDIMHAVDTGSDFTRSSGHRGERFPAYNPRGGDYFGQLGSQRNPFSASARKGNNVVQNRGGRWTKGERGGIPRPRGDLWQTNGGNKITLPIQIGKLMAALVDSLFGPRDNAPAELSSRNGAKFQECQFPRSSPSLSLSLSLSLVANPENSRGLTARRASSGIELTPRRSRGGKD
jgi:hypothetical protein